MKGLLILLAVLIIAAIFSYRLSHVKYVAPPSPIYPTNTPAPTPTPGIAIPDITNGPTKSETKPQFCGGIAGIICPDGFFCEYDGKYPDAGGTCTPAPTKVTPTPSY